MFFLNERPKRNNALERFKIPIEKSGTIYLGLGCLNRIPHLKGIQVYQMRRSESPMNEHGRRRAYSNRKLN